MITLHYIRPNGTPYGAPIETQNGLIPSVPSESSPSIVAPSDELSKLILGVIQTLDGEGQKDHLILKFAAHGTFFEEWHVGDLAKLLSLYGNQEASIAFSSIKSVLQERATVPELNEEIHLSTILTNISKYLVGDERQEALGICYANFIRFIQIPGLQQNRVNYLADQLANLSWELLVDGKIDEARNIHSIVMNHSSDPDPKKAETLSVLGRISGYLAFDFPLVKRSLLYFQSIINPQEIQHNATVKQRAYAVRGLGNMINSLAQLEQHIDLLETTIVPYLMDLINKNKNDTEWIANEAITALGQASRLLPDSSTIKEKALDLAVSYFSRQILHEDDSVADESQSALLDFLDYSDLKNYPQLVKRLWKAVQILTFSEDKIFQYDIARILARISQILPSMEAVETREMAAKMLVNHIRDDKSEEYVRFYSADELESLSTTFSDYFRPNILAMAITAYEKMARDPESDFFQESGVRLGILAAQLPEKNPFRNQLLETALKPLKDNRDVGLAELVEKSPFFQKALEPQIRGTIQRYSQIKQHTLMSRFDRPPLKRGSGIWTKPHIIRNFGLHK